MNLKMISVMIALLLTTVAQGQKKQIQHHRRSGVASPKKEFEKLNSNNIFDSRHKLKNNPVYPIDSIDFEIGTDNRIYVKGKINDSEELRFLFDTGATDMVFNPNSPHKINLDYDKEVLNTGATSSEYVKFSTKNKFQIGHKVIENVSFVAIPYPADFWDGVIGLDFIKRNIIKIDYKKKKIFLYDSEYHPAENEIAFKIKYLLGVPTITVPITINDHVYEVSLEVDTGSDRVLDLNTPFVKKHALLNSIPSFATSTIVGTSAEGGKLYNVKFDEVKIGHYCLPLIPGAFSTISNGVQASEKMDGVLGNNFLKRFNMTLDLKRNIIYLEPNDLMYSPFYDFLVNEK